MYSRYQTILKAVIVLLFLSGCGEAETATTYGPPTTRPSTAIPKGTFLPLEDTEIPPTPPPAAEAPTSTSEPTAAPSETISEPNDAPSTRAGYFSREELIKDARQLAQILESAHPDPYIRGGGRIAFHRRLYQLMAAIPEEGMTQVGFLRLLRPFVAAVGDSHTFIRTGYPVDGDRPGGVPLRFDVVEQSLYVSAVPPGEQSDLIGAILVSVESLQVTELLERLEQVQGTENEYHRLQLLAGFTLPFKPYLKELIPEWEDTSNVRVVLRLLDGETVEMVLSTEANTSRLHTPDSQVRLTTTGRGGFRYVFLDAEKRTAYLRVDHMSYYREAYEIWATSGSNETAEATRDLIPSATETFRELVIDMEAAGTESLIVDLRSNEGGNSLMVDILLYFLYGKGDLIGVMTESARAGGGEVRRYSQLYFDNNPNDSIEDFSQGGAVPMMIGDYDFSADFTGDEEKIQELMLSSATPAFLDNWYQMAPTFYSEYLSEAYAGYYRPGVIVVLVSPMTFSSGFTMMKYLYLSGATLVGTPSAQAANCFGETIDWRLDHTGIEGVVSGAFYSIFPDDPELGRIIPVRYPLTYEKLASYGFDPNAVYLYALELLPELDE
jgi:hypothetical protein